MNTVFVLGCANYGFFKFVRPRGDLSTALKVFFAVTANSIPPIITYLSLTKHYTRANEFLYNKYLKDSHKA